MISLREIIKGSHLPIYTHPELKNTLVWRKLKEQLSFVADVRKYSKERRAAFGGLRKGR